MNTERIYVVAKLRVKDGEVDAFATTAAEVCAAVDEESGTTDYEWFLDPETREATVIEGYTDAAAFAAHMAGPAASLLPKIIAVVEPISLQMLGPVPADLAEGLAPLGFTTNGTIVAGLSS